MSKTSRRTFIMIGAAAAGGAAVASAIEYPLLTSQIQQKEEELAQTNQRIGDLSRGQGFLSLNPQQVAIVEAVAETMIPTDENGPGAKEAGVVYFIDRQLAGGYGKSGNMYLQGPFVQPNQTGSITVQGITYPNGTIPAQIGAGTGYQYPFNLREYWRRGLEFLAEYSNSAYGDNFENLSLETRTQILKDLWDNKPTNFRGPNPREFFFELHDMVTAGFFTDPLYGGNQGMVSWILTGFNGTNQGYEEGFTPRQLALMSSPVRLMPKSLKDIQEEESHNG